MIILTCKECGSEQLQLGNDHCDFICRTCGRPLQLFQVGFMAISRDKLVTELSGMSNIQNEASKHNLTV